MHSISNSPLFSKIAQALSELSDEKNGIRISLSKEPVEVENSDGSKSLIKYLCWNIISNEGEYVTDPILATVHDSLTEQTIEKDLSKFFPNRKCIVDNEIYLDDD